jgi:hypothetical protein
VRLRFRGGGFDGQRSFSEKAPRNLRAKRGKKSRFLASLGMTGVGDAASCALLVGGGHCNHAALGLRFRK